MKRRPKNRDDWCIEHWKCYCDILWAKAIKLRAGHKSELSGEVPLRANGSPGQLHAHHLIDKEVLCYRYDLMNGICLSAAEHKLDKHTGAHRNPFVFHDLWYTKDADDPRWYWWENHHRTGPAQDKLKPKLKDYVGTTKHPGIAQGLEAEIAGLQDEQEMEKYNAK